jgi:hypothetical protein
MKNQGLSLLFCHQLFGQLSFVLLIAVGTVHIQSNKAKFINIYLYNIT